MQEPSAMKDTTKRSRQSHYPHEHLSDHREYSDELFRLFHLERKPSRNRIFSILKPDHPYLLLTLMVPASLTWMVMIILIWYRPSFLWYLVIVILTLMLQSVISWIVVLVFRWQLSWKQNSRKSSAD